MSLSKSDQWFPLCFPPGSAPQPLAIRGPTGSMAGGHRGPPAASLWAGICSQVQRLCGSDSIPGQISKFVVTRLPWRFAWFTNRKEGLSTQLPTQLCPSWPWPRGSWRILWCQMSQCRAFHCGASSTILAHAQSAVKLSGGGPLGIPAFSRDAGPRTCHSAPTLCRPTTGRPPRLALSHPTHAAHHRVWLHLCSFCSWPSCHCLLPGPVRWPPGEGRAGTPATRSPWDGLECPATPLWEARGGCYPRGPLPKSLDCPFALFLRLPCFCSSSLRSLLPHTQNCLLKT